MKILILHILLGVVSLIIYRDVAAQLPEQEQKFLVRLKTELNLSAEQSQSVEKIYLEKQSALDACEKSIKEYEKNLNDEQELQTKVNALNQKKKDIREMRELDVRLLFSPDQLKVYDEKIKPLKPQVLHFGIHDRANCKVCTQ